MLFLFWGGGIMKILILGGTGAMGIHLVKLLADEKNEVYVTSRKSRQSIGNIHYLQGDAHNTVFIDSVLEANFDCIVDFMIYTTEEFKEQYQKFLNNAKQYVYLSSSRVYADSSVPITENSSRLLDATSDEKYLLTDEYALTKARQENLLFDSDKHNWTIIRPYITYSENRLQLGVLEKEMWLSRALSGKTVFFSDDIAKHKTTLTYGYNVAQGIKSVIGKEKSYGEAFHITQDKFLTWKEIWNLYKPVIETYTQKEAKIIFTDMKNFTKVYGATYQIKYDRLFDRSFNNSKIRQFCDTDQFLKPEKGLSHCLESFISDGAHFNYDVAGYNGRVDRFIREFNLNSIKGTINKAKYLIRRIGV